MLQPKGQLLLKADLVKIPFEPKTNEFYSVFLPQLSKMDQIQKQIQTDIHIR